MNGRLGALSDRFMSGTLGAQYFLSDRISFKE